MVGQGMVSGVRGDEMGWDGMGCGWGCMQLV